MPPTCLYLSLFSYWFWDKDRGFTMFYEVLHGSAFSTLALVPSPWAPLALNLPGSLCPQRKPFLSGSFLSSLLGFVNAIISAPASSLVTTSPQSPPPCHLQALIAFLLWSTIFATWTCSSSAQSSSAHSQYLEQSLAGVEIYTYKILSFQGWRCVCGIPSHTKTFTIIYR